MHTKLLLALGSAAWLAMANLASADEVGTGSEKNLEDTQADASADDAMPVLSSDVQYRRRDRSDSSDRTGRNDRSGTGGPTGRGSDGAEGGENGGDGGGDVD